MEETQVANGDTHEAHGKTEGMTEAEFEKARQDGIAYETHRKALAQRAKLKEEAEALRAQLDEYKSREMESQGKYKELVESQRKRISELEAETKAKEKNYQWKVVSGQIQTALMSKGIDNEVVEDALALMTAKHKDDLNTVEVDDSYNVNKDDLSRVVDKFIQSGAGKRLVARNAGVKDLTPGEIEMGEKPKKLSQLSEEELNNLWFNQ